MQNLVSDTKKYRDQLENFGPDPCSGKSEILVPRPRPRPLCRSVVTMNYKNTASEFTVA